MTAELLLREFNRVAGVRGAVEQLRPATVKLALRGDLTADTRNRGGLVPLSAAGIESGMAELLIGRPRYRWKATRTASASVPAEVPDGWTRASLNGTGLFINGLAFKPTDWGSEGRPIIRIQNLSGKSSDYNFTRRAVSRDNAVRDGDLLVSWSATLDTYVWRGEDGVLNQHIFKVVPNSAAVTPRFLFWLLKHEVRELSQSQHAHGLAMMHINRGPFLAHEVLLPSLEEQGEIVGKIDELMALCDELESVETDQEERRDHLRLLSLRNLVKSAEPKGDALFFLRNSPRMITKPEHVADVRQVIFELAVRGRLAPHEAATNGTTSHGDDRLAMPLPDGWRWVRVTDVAEARLGKMLDRARNVGRPYKYLRNTNVHWFDVRTDDLKTVPLDEADAVKYLLRQGDVLICEGGHGIGRAAVWRSARADVAFQKALHRVRPGPELVSDFFAYCVFAYERAGVLRNYFTGVGIPHFTGKALASLVFPLPPVAEQEQIVAKVNELVAVCDELEQSLAAELTERSQLLEALLRDALETGRLPEGAIP